MTDKSNTRMQRLGYRTPSEVAEPDQLVLVEYVSGGRVASRHFRVLIFDVWRILGT